MAVDLALVNHYPSCARLMLSLLWDGPVPPALLRMEQPVCLQRRQKDYGVHSYIRSSLVFLG